MQFIFLNHNTKQNIKESVRQNIKRLIKYLTIFVRSDYLMVFKFIYYYSFSLHSLSTTDKRKRREFNEIGDDLLSL